MFDRDYFFVDSEDWDDGDRAYDRYVETLASIEDFDDASDLIDWDFDPLEIDPEIGIIDF